MKCRICGEKCEQFLDLGKQPLANNFLTKEQFKKEPLYHLTVHVCTSCKTIQTGWVPEMAKVFNKDYAFFTGTSEVMIRHFRDLAKMIDARYFRPLRKDGRRPVIVEIGSNDGTFLQNFEPQKDHAKGEIEAPVQMGFEPSKSVGDIAMSKGVRISSNPFEIHDFGNWPQTDIVVSANTFAHIPDRVGVLKNISKILAPDGTWINEEPYFGKVINRLAFDQFYNEHVYYTSITSMMNTLSMFGMYIDSFEFIPTHGGSIRYFIKKGQPANEGVLAALSRTLGQTFEFDTVNTLIGFGEDVQAHILSLRQRILDINKPLIGYGAPAKMATITNCCGLGPDIIKAVYDSTPSKIGKFSPGMHIPVLSSDEFKKNRVRNVILFIWNHYSEVIAKEGSDKRNWILPVADTNQL